MALMETGSSSKGCYKVFHIETINKSQSDHVRTFCTNKIIKDVTLDALDTPTISIKDIEGVKEFLKSNPKFILDPKGHDPEYKRNENVYNREEAVPTGWMYSAIGIWASSYTAFKNFYKAIMNTCSSLKMT
jgi:hypothetical protein